MIQTAPGEEIDNVHKELLVGEFHIGDDGNFLTVGATFEQDFRQILRIVWGQKVIIFWRMALDVGRPYIFITCSKMLFSNIDAFHLMVGGWWMG